MQFQVELFCEKSLVRKHYSFPFLPATPSSPSRTLDSPHTLLPELQRYKFTVVCRAQHGGPKTPSTTTDAILEYAFVENALFTIDP